MRAIDRGRATNGSGRVAFVEGVHEQTAGIEWIISAAGRLPAAVSPFAAAIRRFADGGYWW